MSLEKSMSNIFNGLKADKLFTVEIKDVKALQDSEVQLLLSYLLKAEKEDLTHIKDFIADMKKKGIHVWI